MEARTILLLFVSWCLVGCLSTYVGTLTRTQSASLEQPELPAEEYEEEIKSKQLNVPETPVEVLNEDKEVLRFSAADALGCSFPIKGGLKSPSPLFIRPGSTLFYPYSNDGSIEVAVNKNIELHCTHRFADPLSGQFYVATCVGGNKFHIDGHLYDIPSIACTDWPEFVANKTGRLCNGGTALINVGFQLSADRFLRAYQVCFNEVEEVTRYVSHRLDAGSNYFQLGIDRIQFLTGGFFGNRNINNFYTQSTQLQTMNRTLGGGAMKYFDSRRGLFLSRGHMGAKSDFVYATQQRSTFLFINVAPQWQSFNGGNWQKVEDGLRAWVSRHKKSVTCWTGVWGVATLPNRFGDPTPLYLTYDSNNNGLIPVPRLYFRVVIEPLSGRGVVLIGVNNPHLTLAEIRNDYVICRDVSSKITWLNWKRTDILAGYSYACDVNEFRKRVTHLPTFKVTGLLY